MSFLKKTALFLFFLLILLLFVWALYLPKEDLQEKMLKTLETQKEKADVAFKAVTFSESLGGEKFWELNATTANLNKDTGLAELQIVKGIFFSKNQPRLYFIAPSARWQMNAKEIYLDSPLGFDTKKAAFLKRLDPAFMEKSFEEQSAAITANQKRSEGFWFQSRYLEWKVADQKIRCNAGIILKSRDVAVQAKNLEGNLALDELVLTENPSAVISTTKGRSGITSIEASIFKFLPKEEVFQTEGGTTINYLDTKDPKIKVHILSQQSRFDQKEEKVFCQGKVQMYYDDIFASAERAIFSPDEQLLTLKEQALVKQKNNKLAGNQINIWLKNKKIKLSGKTKLLLTD